MTTIDPDNYTLVTLKFRVAVDPNKSNMQVAQEFMEVIEKGSKEVEFETATALQFKTYKVTRV